MNVETFYRYHQSNITAKHDFQTQGVAFEIIFPIWIIVQASFVIFVTLLKVIFLTIIFKSQLVFSATDAIDPHYSRNCLLAKAAAGIDSQLKDVNEWSSVGTDNGHDQYDWSVRCEKSFSTSAIVVLRTLEDFEYRGCAVFNLNSKRFRWNVVDRYIQNRNIQFQKCIEDALR